VLAALELRQHGAGCGRVRRLAEDGRVGEDDGRIDAEDGPVTGLGGDGAGLRARVDPDQLRRRDGQVRLVVVGLGDTERQPELGQQGASLR
jgi:hypothetical protein